jgi:hypothetical protein
VSQELLNFALPVSQSAARLVDSEIFNDSGELPELASLVAVIYYSLPEGGKLPGSPFILKMAMVAT